jgi:hypothetical protein
MPLILLAICSLLPAIAQAETVYLVGIPGIDTAAEYTLPSLINALYVVSISLAALLAVIKIVIAGAKYMLSEIVTNKEDAKKDVRGAIFGLLIVIAAALILQVINPQLNRLDAAITPLQFTQTTTGVPTNLPPGTIAGPTVECTGGSCDDEIATCQALPTYVAFQRLSANTFRCYTLPEPPDDNPTVNPDLYDDLEPAILTVILENNYSPEYIEYDISEFDGLTPDERDDLVNEWAESCEEDENDEETGNKYVEIGGDQAGALRRFCFSPL